MILIPEQISYLREQREKLKASMASYRDYLENKEIVSSDYSARALIGDSFTDSEINRERQELHDIVELLENGEYLKERELEQIGIGTKFVIKFSGSEDTDTMILTDCIYGLGITQGFVSTQSPLGATVLGKRPGTDFSYVVKTGKSPLDRRTVSGTVIEIKRDPKEYVHFIAERPKSQRMSKPEKRKLHSLLTTETEEAKNELESYHTITASQKYLLQVEESRLIHKHDTASIARLAVVRKLLESPVVTAMDSGAITVGSKFDLSIVSADSTVTTRTYEMINNAVSEELDDAYVERISPLGESIYGLREKEPFKFRKDNKTYTGIVEKIHTPEKQDEFTSEPQYHK